MDKQYCDIPLVAAGAEKLRKAEAFEVVGEEFKVILSFIGSDGVNKKLMVVLGQPKGPRLHRDRDKKTICV